MAQKSHQKITLAYGGAPQESSVQEKSYRRMQYMLSSDCCPFKDYPNSVSVFTSETICIYSLEGLRKKERQIASAVGKICGMPDGKENELIV